MFAQPRGRYWEGCDLSQIKEGRVLKEGCTKDSLRFSKHDRAWLGKLRPLIAHELSDAALSAQARSGAAPSLDRILLLCARLVCLARPYIQTQRQTERRTSARPSPSLEMLVVGGGPVGLMTAIQTRLVGAGSVTLWDKRSLEQRLRANVVDLGESDCSSPAHPAALTLLENLGILHLGLSGVWSRAVFPRYVHHMHSGTASTTNTWVPSWVQSNLDAYLSWMDPWRWRRAPADEARDNERELENEWALKIEIREVENVLRKVAVLLGINLLSDTHFLDLLPPEITDIDSDSHKHTHTHTDSHDATSAFATASRAWRAVGRRVLGNGGRGGVRERVIVNVSARTGHNTRQDAM